MIKCILQINLHHKINTMLSQIAAAAKIDIPKRYLARQTIPSIIGNTQKVNQQHKQMFTVHMECVCNIWISAVLLGARLKTG